MISLGNADSIYTIKIFFCYGHDNFFLFQKNELGRTEIDPFWKSPNSAVLIYYESKQKNSYYAPNLKCLNFFDKSMLIYFYLKKVK